MDPCQDDVAHGKDPGGEPLSKVILFEYPLEGRRNGERKDRGFGRTKIWLEHPGMVDPTGSRPSERELMRVRSYPAEHQITGTGLHKLGFHKPRPKLTRLEEHNYHGLVLRLERYLSVQEVPVSTWRTVGDNVVSRFSGLFGSEVARTGGKLQLQYFVPVWEILFQIQIAAYESDDYETAVEHLQRWLGTLQPRWRPNPAGDARARVTGSGCTDADCQRPIVLNELQRFVQHAASLYITERDLNRARLLLGKWIEHAAEQNFGVGGSRFWDLYVWLESEVSGDSWSRLNTPQNRPRLEERKIYQPDDLRSWSLDKRQAVQEGALMFQCFRKKYAEDGPLAVMDRGGDRLAQADKIVELIRHPPSDLRIFGRAVRENQNNPKLGQLLRAITENHSDPTVIFRALRVSFELAGIAREVDFVISRILMDSMRAELEAYRDHKASGQHVIDTLSDPVQMRTWLREFEQVLDSGHAIGL